MNFRPTKTKVILSILFPVLLFTIVFTVNFISPPNIIGNFLSLHDMDKLLSKNNIVLFIIEFVVFYLIFSLLHRRHQHWNQPIKPLHHA